MKCLARSVFFRPRARQPLALPMPLTPQHPKSRMKLVNDIMRRSLSKHEVSRRTSFDGGIAGEECSVADSLSDITRENEWFLLHVAEPLPLARSKHAAVASGEIFYVVGGASVDGQLGDVQVFNTDEFSWKELFPAGLELSSGECKGSNGLQIPPAPRLLSPSAGIWKGKLIVVGCEASAPKDSPLTVHRFDPSQGTWSTLKPKGEFPEARVGYRIVQVKSTLVIFGGEDASGRIGDDVVVLDLDKMTWLHLQTTGEKPAPRKYHAMACYGGRYIWIYGGKSYATYYNDIYCLDLEHLMWTKVKVYGPIPTMPRAGHVGIIRGESFYIVGGENRGDEMVDTLVFDIPRRAWSVVTSIHAMSPLAHNGLSVVKINHENKQYLVAFGGHGILLSCQMYALLLPSMDPVSGGNSLSSSESLSLNKISKISTLTEDTTFSPTDPFQFDRATSRSSSSLDYDSMLASADSYVHLALAESSVSFPSRRERPPRVRTIAGSLDSNSFVPWGRPSLHDVLSPNNFIKPYGLLLAEELSQPSRLSNVAGNDDPQPLSQTGTENCQEVLITIEQNSLVGSWGSTLRDTDEGRKLEDLEGKSYSRQLCDAPHVDAINAGRLTDDPQTSGKKNRVETDVINRKLKVVLKGGKELQEVQRSSQAKDEDLNIALLTIKELRQEIHELKRNGDNKERRVQNKSNSVELRFDKQSRRNSPRDGNGSEMRLQETTKAQINMKRNVTQTDYHDTAGNTIY